jgi:hypothetical protein
VEHGLSAILLAFALIRGLGLQPQWRAALSSSGESELSRHPRHATAVDGDSDLSFPHTRDATTRLCSAAHDDTRICSELRRQNEAATSLWEQRPHHGAVALLTAALLIPAATSVLFLKRQMPRISRHAGRPGLTGPGNQSRIRRPFS